MLYSNRGRAAGKATQNKVSTLVVGRFVTLSLLILAACPGGRRDEREVRGAAGAFYEIYIKLHPSGVPSKDQQAQFREMVSADLAGLLNQAADAEANYFKETNGESPPMIEGDLFTSLFEGAESYKVLQCENKNTSWTCVVELTHGDIGGASNFSWKDRVFLVREKVRWVVDDIEFLGDWEFMHKGRLKGLLKEVIEEGKRPAG